MGQQQQNGSLGRSIRTCSLGCWNGCLICRVPLKSVERRPLRASKWLDSLGESKDTAARPRQRGGSDPELLPRVFNLFMRADRALSHLQGGMGIGLTLVRKLVECTGDSESPQRRPRPGERVRGTTPRLARVG